MRKTEIKSRLEEIAEAIENLRGNLEDILEPHKELCEHLDAIDSLELNYSFNIDIDIEDAKHTALSDLIESNDDWVEIGGMIENLLEELNFWYEDVSERKAEEIQERYIEPISNMDVNFCLDDVTDLDSLDDMLIGVLNYIEEIEL